MRFGDICTRAVKSIFLAYLVTILEALLLPNLKLED